LHQVYEKTILKKTKLQITDMEMIYNVYIYYEIQYKMRNVRYIYYVNYYQINVNEYVVM